VAKTSAGNWRSIWMPRYLAVVTPAMLIVLAIGLVRLPGRAVKAIAIAAFVAVNLIQYGARIKLDPEPRVDLMAKDVAEGDRDPAVAVFVRDRYAMGAPGTAAIADITGRFYLFQWVGGTYTPTQMRNGPTDQMLKHSLGRFHSISWIKGELARRPEAQRLILWDRESVSRNETLEMIQQALGDKWELVGTWAQNTRRHWNWQDMDSLRRMEFKRIGPPPEPVKDNRPLLGE
jgi:hypothetical protein